MSEIFSDLSSMGFTGLKNVKIFKEECKAGRCESRASV